MKRPETLFIEKVLHQSLFGTNPKLAKEYGISEVTIDFTYPKEIVDFMSYDPKKNIIRCYEIKISMQDFHSKAKKSWYGNYNYLVLSKKLYYKQSLDEWKKEVPKDVGIIIVSTDIFDKEVVKKASKRNIDDQQISSLKDSLIRRLFYKTCE